VSENCPDLPEPAQSGPESIILRRQWAIEQQRRMGFAYSETHRCGRSAWVSLYPSDAIRQKRDKKSFKLFTAR
jgi:hypothetical protein